MSVSPFFFQTVKSPGSLQLQVWLVAGTAADAADLTLTFDPAVATFTLFTGPGSWFSNANGSSGSVLVALFDGGLGANTLATKTTGLLGSFDFTLANGATSFTAALTTDSDLYDANGNPIAAQPPAPLNLLLLSTSAVAVSAADALQSNNQVTTFTVADTAKNVAAALGALAADTKLTAIALTDGGTPGFTLTASQFAADASVLAKITSPFTVSVTGAPVSAAPSLQTNAVVGSFSVADTAANVSVALGPLAGDSKLNAITLTDAGTPVLGLTALQYNVDTAILAKITSAFGVSVTGALVAAAPGLQANNQITAFSITDTAANVGAALSTLSADSKLTAITLTNGGTPTLALTAAQFAAAGVALAKIASAFSTTVAGVLVTAAPALQADPKVGSFTIADTAATVSAALGTLAADTKLTAIALTDSGTPVLALTAPQYSAGTTVLAKIAGAYGVIVSDALVSGAAALQADSKVVSFAVSDSAAAVSGGLDALAGYARLSSIGLTGANSVLTISYGQLTNDSVALGKISGAFGLAITAVSAANAQAVQANAQVTGFAVADTAAAISSAFDALQAASKLTAIGLTDSNALAISYQQLTNDTTALGLLPNTYSLIVSGVPASAVASVQANSHVVSFSVSDSSAAVSAAFDTLNATTKLTSISLTDAGAIATTAAQLGADTSVLGKLPNGASLAVSGVSVASAGLIQANTHVTGFAVADSASAVMAGLDALAGFGKLTSIGLTNGGTPVLSLSYTQYAADTAALAAISGSFALVISGAPASAAASLQADKRVSGFTATGVSVTQATAVQGDSKATSFTVADSASAVGVGLDALAVDTKLLGIVLTDGGTPTLSITHGQYGNDSAALALIGSGFNLIVSGAPASAAATLQGDSRVTRFAASDTAAHIAVALDTLSAATKLSSIALTDTGTQVLAITFAQYLNDGLALAAIGQAYQLTVSGAPVWAAALLQGNQRVVSFTVSDTAADVAAAIDLLNQDSLLGSIGVTDTKALSIGYSQLLADGAALGKLTGVNPLTVTGVPAIAAASVQANAAVTHFAVLGASAAGAAAIQAFSKVTSFSVSDNWPHVQSNIVALIGDTKLATVNFISLPSSTGAATTALTVTQTLEAYAASPSMVSVAIFDSAVDVGANLDDLQSALPVITSITLTDTTTPALTITGAQYAADGGVLAAIGSGFELTVTNAATALASQLRNDTLVTSFTIADTASHITTALPVLVAAPTLSSIAATGTIGGDTLDLTGLAVPATISLSGNTAAAAVGLSSPTLSFIGSADAITLGSGKTTIGYNLQPSGGIETIASFQYGIDQIVINLEGAPNSALRASDITAGGVHAIAIYNVSDPTHGIVLTGMPVGQTAADLLGSHTTFTNGQVIIA